MGCNYYLHRNVCPTCDTPPGEPLHIGKSSAGWCFALRVDRSDPDPWDDEPVEEIKTFDDWVRLFNESDSVIKDEYDRVVSVEDMISIISRREFHTDSSRFDEPYDASRGPYTSWADFHSKNGSKPGPNGLLRQRVDGRHCIANGEGTWDYVVGEFS